MSAKTHLQKSSAETQSQNIMYVRKTHLQQKKCLSKKHVQNCMSTNTHLQNIVCRNALAKYMHVQERHLHKCKENCTCTKNYVCKHTCRYIFACAQKKTHLQQKKFLPLQKPWGYSAPIYKAYKSANQALKYLRNVCPQPGMSVLLATFCARNFCDGETMPNLMRISNLSALQLTSIFKHSQNIFGGMTM